MGVFFGTDGLRGKVNDDLSFEVAYRCGNSLGSLGSKILIGRDTRGSGSFLTSAFACGVMNSGGDVTDIGVCPTAGVSYLTKLLGFDYGVVISASHNPAEFNGIKIFDKNGLKLGDKREEAIERKFLKSNMVAFDKLGKYHYNDELVLDYEKFLYNLVEASTLPLKNKTIVLDTANGASFNIAPKVFEKCGAKVFAINSSPDGLNINKNAGALHTEEIQKKVVEIHADMGFAFDGDSDRVIAIDEKGNVIDGDKIIYLFALAYKENGKLNPAEVVGTRHTNMGVEKALESKGISLIRTDIGDKYVSQKLIERNLLIGGEQSGHVILRDKLVTGDGILNALEIAKIVTRKNKYLSELIDFESYFQVNINVKVSDKLAIINSEKLFEEQEKQEKLLCGNGRIMIRLSGTEPYIRIMVESKDEKNAKKIGENLKKIVTKLNMELEKCAE